MKQTMRNDNYQGNMTIKEVIKDSDPQNGFDNYQGNIEENTDKNVATSPVSETPVDAVDEKEIDTVVNKYATYLFKTPTCPNCKAASALLDRAGVDYTSLNANDEKDLVSKFGIKQAPTLVLINGDSFEKYRGVSNIKGWLMSNHL